MYLLEKDEQCKREIRKLTSKNKALSDALAAKLNQILENPYHFKPLSNVLAGSRHVHVMRHFVLIYDIDENGKKVLLRRFSHHDEAY